MNPDLVYLISMIPILVLFLAVGISIATSPKRDPWVIEIQKFDPNKKKKKK